MLAATDDCEQMWEKFDSQYSKMSLQEQINLWKEKENKCSPMGYYYYQLARMYFTSGDITQAKHYSDKGLALRDTASRYVEYMDLGIRFSSISSVSSFDGADLSKLENDAEDFIAKYPDWGMSYAFMALLRLAKEDYQGAIDLAEKSEDLEGGVTPHIGRTLTIAYTMTKKYREALKTGNDASALDNSLFSDKYFMLAMVRSYIALEDIDTGAKVLKLLIRTKPELSDDNDVQTFVKYLQKKLKERESS